MEDDNLDIATSEPMELATANAGSGAPEWVTIMPSGPNIAPNDGRKPWRLEDVERVIKASMTHAGRLVVDYDHQTDYASRPGVGGQAPAAGWISDMRQSDDGLQARIDWTNRGSAAVAAKEYRYISPVFKFHQKTRSITEIIRAGLTNDPALTMKAINRSNLTMSDEQPGDDPVTAPQSAKDREAKAQDPSPATKQAEATALEDDPKRDLEATVARLSMQVETLSHDMATAASKTAVATAIQAGKLPPALEDWALEYCSHDAGGFSNFLEKMPSLKDFPLMEIQEAAQAASLDPEDLAVCSALGLDPKEFAATKQTMKKETGDART